MKAYTDIKQSKKLAEILPIESADMEYISLKKTNELIGSVPFVKDELEAENSAYDATYDRIPCWSLLALFKFIPRYIKNVNVLRFDIKEKDFSVWYDELGCGLNTELPKITMENPVNACYEMILKLHELKML